MPEGYRADADRTVHLCRVISRMAPGDSTRCRRLHLRALAKNPEDRYSDILYMRDDLQELFEASR
jgi:hypothetical protein